jgi:FkbM family methyltransferase
MAAKQQVSNPVEVWASNGVDISQPDDPFYRRIGRRCLRLMRPFALPFLARLQARVSSGVDASYSAQVLRQVLSAQQAINARLGTVTDTVQTLKRKVDDLTLNVNKSQEFQREPFEELLEIPRLTEQKVQLLGRDFTIADPISFFFSYREIFVQENYRFDATTDSPRVIDCGSNYGTSIVYIKHIYPKARVTGIEADPKIFSLLKGNCSHVDVELLNKAVSHNREPVKFYCEGSVGGRAAQALEAPKEVVTVDAVTLDDLIDGPVDFLKIDIEGSEAAALAACTKLSMVQNLFVEYHSFKATSQALGDMLNSLRESGFRYYIHHAFCSPTPLTREELCLGMDLQLNIFAKRPAPRRGETAVPSAS